MLAAQTEWMQRGRSSGIKPIPRSEYYPVINMIANVTAILALGIWIYLLCARGRFWAGLERDNSNPATPPTWPSVAAVIPARNEAECVEASISSLMKQDYPGRMAIFLIDDNSDDGTATVAHNAASAAHDRHPLTVVTGRPVPRGWTGKLWAVKQGIDAAQTEGSFDYLLLVDADIVHAPDTVRWLVRKAEAGRLVLTSFMAKLRCKSLAERSHVPAFIFFFQMLYPFSWVNHADSEVAAAAGGCMLVKAADLHQAGGIEGIRGALIDDCALARSLKALGPIWLGLTDRVRSVRPYEQWQDVKSMISRSAYAQLRYSPLLLLGTTAGLALTFLAAPLLAIFADGPARLIGIVAWALMALAFQPTLRFYRRSPLWGFALPGIALLYMLYTLESAVQYSLGRGGSWKGRVQANVSQQ
jgi:hopene-associated glycosyltransferase HpnB